MSVEIHNPLQSALYNLLARTSWLDKYRLTARIWQALWRRSCRIFGGTVRTSIHGRPVLASYGHTYPIYARKYHTLNNPLIELVYQTYSAKQAPITVVDIGANIGDTIMMIDANCPGMLGRYFCVEGDTDFFQLLQHNLGGDPRGTLLHELLSDYAGVERRLVRTNAGTASARGEHSQHARTLDAALGDAVPRIDVLKSDVDGFDGRALAGARQLLQRDRPAVIFEWHPLLCRQTGNDWNEHFQVLSDCGYDRFVWFTKFGAWSHFMLAGDASIAMMADVCLHSRTYGDWHYDIAALHEHSTLSQRALADLRFAQARRSFF